MAEAIVSGVLKQLGSFAVQSIQEELKLVVGLNKGVEKLTSKFKRIQSVLVDAEQRHVKEETVRDWLEKLKDVSYDVDHVLDQWRTANLQIDEEAEHADTFMSKVCSCFLFPYFVIKRVALGISIAFKIKAINERLDDIAKEKDSYDFKTTATIIEQPIDRESTSFIDVSEVVGLDEQQNYLVGKLLNESREEQTGLQTISIIGVGGIGKTTLAQLAYNDNKVTDFFEKKIWVCVSDPFDKLRVAKAILETLEGRASDLSTLQSLLDKISKSLSSKKFLIVLDDVWTETDDDWKPFHHCLKNGLHGSKVLVTTRKQTTALILKSIDQISIKELSEEHCWSLFGQFAFFGRSNEERKKLEEIGREIVIKCKGLPLAAKTMGSLLRFKGNIEEWENILDSEMWRLREFENDVFLPLLLSYYDLLPMVKRCFTYCAMFPKDFEFEKHELIKLWMAQGYLELEHNKEIEIIGEEYFNCLAMRSFFQDFDKDDDGSIIRCKMHDIVHDVAQYLSKNECCMIDVKDFTKQRMNDLCEKARHLRLIVKGSDTFPITICNFKKLRSLLIEFGYVGSKLIGTVLPKLFDELTCLKALGISGHRVLIEDIPKEIGKLIHLRYLDLSNNRKLIKLPETLCELYNLQTLKLDFCKNLKELPQGIGKLIHLRYLDLSNNRELIKLPETLCELYNLQTLKLNFCKNLKELPQGIGKLINLRHLMNLRTDSLRYMPKGMERLIHLRTLNEFCLNGDDYGGKTCSLEFLGHIESLRIKGLKILAKVTDEMVHLKDNKNIRDLGLVFYGSDLMNNDDEAILEGSDSMNNNDEAIIEGSGSDSMNNDEGSDSMNNDDEAILEGSDSMNNDEGSDSMNNDDEAILEGLDSMNNDDEAILEAFQPPPNLQELTIMYYSGPTMSTLRRMTSLTNLKSITLDGCYYCLHLPPLGKLPFLETLFIRGMVSAREVGNEFLGVDSGEASSSSSSIIYFPNLKTLRFENLWQWEVWDFGNEDDTCTIMPSLRSLELYECYKLKGLPKQLLHQMAPLQNLKIYECYILEEVYEEGKGDKWQDISHIPNIKFIPYWG